MLTALLDAITISTGSFKFGYTDIRLTVSCRRPKLITMIYVGLFAKDLIKNNIRYLLNM